MSAAKEDGLLKSDVERHNRECASLSSTGLLSPNRLTNLDLLRCLAVLLVLGRHLGNPPDTAPWIVRAMAASAIRIGWVGVDLFFVLSGFLVSGLLLREYRTKGTLDISRFLVRRGFKIYPAFWALIAVSVAVVNARGSALPPDRILSELVFIQNYRPGMWPHTWSLAVEEHFYLSLAGLMAFLARRKSVHWLPAVVGIVLVACLSLRWQLVGEPYDHYTHLFPTHLRIDSLALGVLLSYVWHTTPLPGSNLLRRIAPWLVIGGGLGLLWPIAFPLEKTRWVPVIGLSALALASAAMVLGALAARPAKGRVSQLAAGLGSYSYSIYLWHMAIHNWIVVPLHLSWLLYASTYVTLALLGGVLMARLIEVPALALRDRIAWTRDVSAGRGSGRDRRDRSAANPTAAFRGR